ncbi:MAG: hypothetical protein SGPRY_014603 [Prymnesium sp.]
MIVPLEALFYLDVAKRAIDEMLAIGEERGMIDKGVLPKSEYLPPETLDMFLVRDDESGGSEASEFLEEYEAAMLKQLNDELNAT